MEKSFLSASIFLVALGAAGVLYVQWSGTVSRDIPPLPPDTGDKASSDEIVVPSGSSALAAAIEAITDPDYPVRLSIPAISLKSSIDKVGVNSKGEMDVPDGTTNEVGWYKNGTVPGQRGSAVIDAHVFAAFAKLKKLNVGEDIYIETEKNKTLHFVIEDVQTYKLGEVPTELLFNRADGKRLNLITCAGRLTADRSTYDHRLVVYAQLAE